MASAMSSSARASTPSSSTRRLSTGMRTLNACCVNRRATSPSWPIGASTLRRRTIKASNRIGSSARLTIVAAPMTFSSRSRMRATSVAVRC